MKTRSFKYRRKNGDLVVKNFNVAMVDFQVAQCPQSSYISNIFSSYNGYEISTEGDKNLQQSFGTATKSTIS